MIIYILNIVMILTLASICFYNGISKVKTKVFLFICFWPMFLIPALRSQDVGTDAGSYKMLFLTVANDTGTNLLSRYQQESGFIFFNKLTAILGQNSQVILVTTGLFIALAIVFFIYFNSVNPWMSMYLFVTLYYFYTSFNGIRQYMAILLVANSYYFAKKQKIIPFLFITFIAFIFHNTAIIGIFIYILFFLKLNNKKVVLASIAGIGILLFYKYILFYSIYLFPQYQNYFYTENLQGGGVMSTIVYGLIFLFGLFVKLHICNDMEYNVLLILVYIAALVAILSLNFEMLNRVGWYFNIFSIIFIPYAIKKIANRKIKALFYCSIIAVAFAYNLYFLSVNYHEIVPYTFFWNW